MPPYVDRVTKYNPADRNEHGHYITKGKDSPWWPTNPWIDAEIQRRGKPCTHIFDDDHGLEDEAMVGWSGAVTDVVASEK